MTRYNNIDRINRILKEELDNQEVFEIEVKDKKGKPHSDLIWAKDAQEAIIKFKEQNSMPSSSSISVNTLSYEQIQKMKEKFEKEVESVKKKIAKLLKDYRSQRDVLASAMTSANKLDSPEERKDVDKELAKIDALFKGVAKEDTDDAEDHGEKRAEKALKAEQKVKVEVSESYEDRSNVSIEDLWTGAEYDNMLMRIMPEGNDKKFYCFFMYKSLNKGLIFHGSVYIDMSDGSLDYDVEGAALVHLDDMDEPLEQISFEGYHSHLLNSVFSNIRSHLPSMINAYNQIDDETLEKIRNIGLKYGSDMAQGVAKRLLDLNSKRS